MTVTSAEELHVQPFPFLSIFHNISYIFHNLIYTQNTNLSYASLQCTVSCILPNEKCENKMNTNWEIKDLAGRGRFKDVKEIPFSTTLVTLSINTNVFSYSTKKILNAIYRIM